MSDRLRVAIRKFDGFERSITRQYQSFQAATGCPLELEYEALDLNPLVDSLFTQGGLKDGTWDVAFVVTDWIADAVAQDALLDLAPMMAVNPVPGYPEGWSPALTWFQAHDGAVFGLPYHDGPECLIYRTDLFNDPAERRAFAVRYGHPLAVPQTWDQFEDVARFFTRPEEDRYGTVFAAYPDGHNTVYDFFLQVWSRGGELVDDDGRPTIDSPEAEYGLNYYRRMVNDRSVTPPGLQEIDSVKSGELFTSGKIAMMVNWFGFAALCEQPDSPIRGKVDVAPVPAGPGGDNVSLNVYWVLGVGTGSRHPEEAFAFIRHCCTPEMDKITTFEGGIGCRLSTWSDPEVNATIPFYHKLAGLHERARALPRSQSLPALVHLLDAAVQQAITTNESTDAILQRAQRSAAGLRL